MNDFSLVIHIVCTDPDRGMYLAYDKDCPNTWAAGSSPEGALGNLFTAYPDLGVEVVAINY